MAKIIKKVNNWVKLDFVRSGSPLKRSNKGINKSDKEKPDSGIRSIKTVTENSVFAGGN